MKHIWITSNQCIDANLFTSIAIQSENYNSITATRTTMLNEWISIYDPTWSEKKRERERKTRCAREENKWLLKLEFFGRFEPLTIMYTIQILVCIFIPQIKENREKNNCFDSFIHCLQCLLFSSALLTITFDIAISNSSIYSWSNSFWTFQF